MKRPKLILALPFLLGFASPLMGEALETPTDLFQELSRLMEAGEVKEGFKLMTKEARQEYILDSLGALLFAVEDKMELKSDFVLPDGTKVKASLEDLGLNDFTPPDVNNVEEYNEALLSLFKKAEDKEHFLRSMELLSSELEGGFFDGKVVETPNGIAPKKETIWVELEEDYVIAMSFRKEEEALKYAGMNWDAIDELSRLHVEREVSLITGKTAEGKEIKLSDYEGKVVLIDFWGTW